MLFAMKTLWNLLKDAMTRDDLFYRVLFLLFGLGIGSIGVLGFFWLLTNDTSHESFWFLLFAWIITILFTVWGLLLLSRCMLTSQSRLTRFVEKIHPESADEGAIFLIVIFLLPAVLLTLILRLFGVRGSATVIASNKTFNPDTKKPRAS